MRTQEELQQIVDDAPDGSLIPMTTKEIRAFKPRPIDKLIKHIMSAPDMATLADMEKVIKWHFPEDS